MDFLKILEDAGFTVVRRETPREMPVEIFNRYKNIPPEYPAFLQQFRSIINREDTSWFNSIEDFSGETDTDFQWNAFELMSLEAFENDREETENVKNFWNSHIPIVMSVTEYQYMAICLESDRYGEIVYGVEPEFEETMKVCNSFEQLLRLFENPPDNKYIKFFM